MDFSLSPERSDPKGALAPTSHSITPSTYIRKVQNDKCSRIPCLPEA